VAFDEYVKLKEEEKKVTFDEVVSEKFKSESKEEPKLEQKPTEGGVLEKVVKESTTEKFSKEFKSSVFQEKEAAPAVVQKPREFSEAMSDLLKIIRDFKEDLVGLETWPYSSDSPFEVAKEYYEMKLYQPAVEEFQKLLGDPRYRLQSMTYLGKIFYERGELDFAEAILRKAIEEAGYMEKESIEAYYYLALTLEALKRFMEAKELYLRVYIFDSSFRDVAAKVMTLRSKAL
jgi:tetratricopeptide (TPR) repeat protein